MAESFGYVPNPAATEAFIARLPKVYGEQVAALPAKDDGKDALNYRALVTCLKRSGLTQHLRDRDGVACLKSRNQGNVGSCTGNAEATDMDVLAGVEIAIAGENEEFRAMASAAALYALGREKANMLRGGDGCYGSALADAVREWGTLHEMPYPGLDLTGYTADLARRLGKHGIPADLKPVAAEHKCLHTANVKTAEEGWSLIGSGYTVNICSMVGFQGKRDAQGVIRRRGSWAHSMAVTSRRTTSAGTRLVLVHQSWGDDWTDGPYWEDMPWGSFWIVLEDFAAVLAQGDSFAHARYEGFQPRALPDFGAGDYL